MAKETSDWIRLDKDRFFHTFSHLGSLEKIGPQIISRGDGIYVYDTFGKKYIEGNSGLWNAAFGFNNDQLHNAALNQFKALPSYHTFFGRNTKPSIELADQLLRNSPIRDGKVFFTNSGSEANESVVKILWMINRSIGLSDRRKLIARKNGYHGTTVLASSLTGKDYIKAFGLPTSDILYAECPHYWRYGHPGESESEYSNRLSDNLETLIIREDPQTIAGFWAEPVIGAGGVIPPPVNYFKTIQAVLKKYQIPMVIDEVICGLGRTGSLWGCDTYDITPDILITSKVLTGGYFPLAAVLLSKPIAEQLSNACIEFEEFPHGFTTGGHPVGCAIGLKVLEILLSDGLLEHVKEISKLFNENLAMLSRHNLVGESRGVGLMGALEIVADKQSKEPFPSNLDVTEKLANSAINQGLIMRPLGQSIVLAPPFIITEQQMVQLFDILHSTLDDVEKQLRP